MNRNQRNRFSAVVALMILAGLTASTSAVRASTDADVRAGVYGGNTGGVGVGGGVLTGMGSRSNWYFNPNLEAAFGERSDQVAVNADFHYDFTTRTAYSTYLGGGPAMMWRNPEIGEDDTEPGINVLGGLVAKRGDVRPFVQVKGVLMDRSQVAVVGGVRF